MIIEATEVTLDGFAVGGNSTSTIKNARVTMTEPPLTVNFAPENPVHGTAGSNPQIGSLIAVGTLIVITMVLAFCQWKGKFSPQVERE